VRLPREQILCLLLLTGSLIACTPVRWERPDTDAATQEADTQECRGFAHRAYRTLTEEPLFLPYFMTIRDNKGRTREVPVVPSRHVGPPVWLPYAPGLALEPLSLRRDIFERCLQRKGYNLVPDED
jgi:hypothetical protein